jgi:hypothetical protein
LDTIPVTTFKREDSASKYRTRVISGQGFFTDLPTGFTRYSQAVNVSIQTII